MKVVLIAYQTRQSKRLLGLVRANARNTADSARSNRHGRAIPHTPVPGRGLLATYYDLPAAARGKSGVPFTVCFLNI